MDELNKNIVLVIYPYSVEYDLTINSLCTTESLKDFVKKSILFEGQTHKLNFCLVDENGTELDSFFSLSSIEDGASIFFVAKLDKYSLLRRLGINSDAFNLLNFNIKIGDDIYSCILPDFYTGTKIAEMFNFNKTNSNSKKYWGIQFKSDMVGKFYDFVDFKSIGLKNNDMIYAEYIRISPEHKICVELRILPEGEEFKVVLPLSSTGRDLKQFIIDYCQLNRLDSRGNLIYFVLVNIKSHEEIFDSETLYKKKIKSGSTLIFKKAIYAGAGFFLPDATFIEFNNWLYREKINYSVFTSIPECKFEELAQRFFKDMNYDSSKYNLNPFMLKELILRPFYYSALNSKRSLLNEFFDIIFNRRKRKKIFLSESFKRYMNVQYHGVLLFPSGKNICQKFIENYWKDLNILTNEYIDIYYTEDSGYKIFSEIKSIHHLDGQIVLPSLVVWDLPSGLNKAVYINFGQVNDLDILRIINILVNGLKQGKSLGDLRDYILTELAHLLNNESVVYLNHIENQIGGTIINLENFNKYADPYKKSEGK